MRILILDPYYPAFLESVYAAEPGLGGRPYDEQWRLLMDQCFGVADFYSFNLRALGHEAMEIVPNCIPLQERWLLEHGEGSPPGGEPGSSERLSEILLRQIRRFRPDVLHVQDCISLDAGLIAEARQGVRIATTQIACPMPAALDFSPYDLVLSSMPHFVRRFRELGLRTELFRLGFEPRVLERVPERTRHGAVFVGGVSPAHGKRLRLLEALAAEGLVEWWGYGVEALPPGSALRLNHHGEAWGLGMYDLLAGCEIALNDHIDIAGDHANNMRLYEATGSGALLLTDDKSDLSEYFEPGLEILTYRTASEAAEAIRYYTQRPQEVRAIAARGQTRTLGEYTYALRMQEFANLLARRL